MFTISNNTTFRFSLHQLSSRLWIRNENFSDHLLKLLGFALITLLVVNIFRKYYKLEWKFLIYCQTLIYVHCRNIFIVSSVWRASINQPRVTLRHSSSTIPDIRFLINNWPDFYSSFFMRGFIKYLRFDQRDINILACFLLQNRLDVWPRRWMRMMTLCIKWEASVTCQ